MIALVLMATALATVGDARRAGRPVLQAPVHSTASPDGRFRIHWSSAAGFAPAGTSSEGQPDAIEQLFGAIERAEVAFAQRGYRPVVGDGGAGGDRALDIYLLPIDANGYAYALRASSEDDGASCYIEIDNGLRGAVLQSVVQHELHHCVQYRYTTQASQWLYEASATWEQYRLADDSLDLGLQVLYATRLAEPDRPMDDLGSRYEYAGLLAFRHLEELYRPAPRSAQIWQALERQPDWELAFDHVTRSELGLSVEQWFAIYSTYNAFACGLSDEQHYNEAFAPCTSPQTVPLTEVSRDEPFEVELARVRFTSQTVQLDIAEPEQAVSLHCDAPSSGRMVVTLTAVSAEGVADERVRSGQSDQALSVRLGRAVPTGGTVRAVFASIGDDPLTVTCALSSAPITTPHTASCSHSTPSGPWAVGGLIAWLGIPSRRRRSRC